MDGLFVCWDTAGMATEGGQRVRQARRTQAERTAATRAALLNATLESLVSNGFGGTTTSEVAQRAGVSPGALLHHFPAKADLLCAAVAHLLEMRRAEFRKAMANLEPGADRVEAGIDLLWSMFSGSAFVAWLELWGAARTDPALAEAVTSIDREFMAASQAIFDELLAEEIAAAPELGRFGLGLVYAVMGGLALSRQVPGYEPLPADTVLTAFKTLVRNALLPAPDGGNRHGDP
jgi:AcrR family transcriptional regulator